jgi:phosphatidylserine/phosphatidylglycerophosphate/cardiolipin synthase-like enzyme
MTIPAARAIWRLAEDCSVTKKDYNSLVMTFERTYNQQQRRASLRLLSGLLASALLVSLIGCTSAEPPTEFPLTVEPTSQAPAPIPLKVGYGFDGGWYQVYFTDPENPFSSQISGGVDGPLVEAINSARQSVDVAAYSLSLNSVRNALIDAHQRGVAVRVVMESENMDRSDPQKLIEAGVPVVGDRREGLMHNKFIVIDRSEVWTGSMNFTEGGAYKDNNNLIRIRSTQLAENFTTEFEEMFLTDVYGPEQGVETPHQLMRVNETKMENFFSPDDGTAQRISELLNNANESIYFLAYSFTNDEFGQILIRKPGGGLEVSGVMEEEQVNSNQGTEFDPLSQAGIDVKLDGNTELMHHKVFIIDGEVVILGSYNFSQNAEIRNDENSLIIFNSEIANLFLQEFQRIYFQAQNP